MTSYRGVDQYELVESLEQAYTLIQELDLGPATKAWFADWNKDQPYNQILAAVTAKEMAVAMRETNARHAFTPFQDIFAFQGMVSNADNLNDGAPNLYRDLAAWGAFQSYFSGQKPRPVPAEMQEEIDAYLTIQGFLRIEKADQRYGGNSPHVVNAAEQRDRFLKELGEDNEILAEDLLEYALVYAMLTHAGYEDEIRRLVQLQPAHERKLMNYVLYLMSDLRRFRSQVIDVPRPLEMYGLAIDALPVNEDVVKGIKSDLYHELAQKIAPHFLIDEANLVNEGYSNRELPNTLVYFIGTKRAAQHIADAMPGVHVVQYSGVDKPKLIVPRGPKPNSGLLPGGPQLN